MIGTMSHKNKPKSKESGQNKKENKKPRKLYFDNPVVEKLLKEYVDGGCVCVSLRDQIMSHAEELIRQVIRTHNLHNIYGKDPASFNDLFQLAWVQIERTLYKYDSSPGHTKVFNMWSQISRTVILAHIKREGRDKKNYNPYLSHTLNKENNKISKENTKLERFIEEAYQICKYNPEFVNLIACIEELYETDNKPHDGLIGKLVKGSGLSRAKVHQFIQLLRLRSFDFTDSPVNTKNNHNINLNIRNDDHDEEDD